MWRRVASLSRRVSSSKSPRLLDQAQVAYEFNAWKMFTTQALNQAEGGASDGRKIPFVTFVLELLLFPVILMLSPQKVNLGTCRRWGFAFSFIGSFGAFQTMKHCKSSLFEAFKLAHEPHKLQRNDFDLIVTGGPGSGKGTQCTRIVETFGFTHLSAGDLLRKEISSNSENGSMILSLIKEGKIVPSEMTVKLIQKAIEERENDRYLIDGFPRSEENRIAYERVIGAEPDMVLFFDCPEEEMVRRVLNRNQGRVDDNIETVKERLKVFAELNLPVIRHYSKKGKLYKIDGTGSEEEIFERVRPVFAALRGRLEIKKLEIRRLSDHSPVWRSKLVFILVSLVFALPLMLTPNVTRT
ncbi:hypothetical protein CASFOL_008417 [Castilleja foliolosa]|uniref:adenylate kinase n=1 Tax=Castilleja foliolosa TaxID=1961234 RepID=A0ABD3E2X4_9LAMI